MPPKPPSSRRASPPRSFSRAERERQRASTASSQAITPADSRRYFDYRAGISAEELAARENVRLDTIQKSIQKFESHKARHSSESVELAARQVFIDRLPEASRLISEGMAAIETITRATHTNPETGEVTFDYDEVPDWSTRFKAIDAMRKIVETVTPKTPMVTVDARSQTNIQNLGGGHPGGGPAAVSFEQIVREIRAERGLALSSGSEAPEVKEVEGEFVEVDVELEDELEDDEDGDGDDGDDGDEDAADEEEEDEQ